MEIKEEKRETFQLPQKKVIVRPIRKQRGMIDDSNHAGFFMVEGSDIEFTTPRNNSNGSVVCPLTAEEREFFEDSSRSGLHYSRGDLSPTAPRRQNFWYGEESRVKLKNEDKYLDLSDPKDYLTYKILLANRRMIAPSWDKRGSKATYLFAIVDEDQVAEENVAEKTYKEKAWKAYSEMKNSEEKLRDFLFAIGKKPSDAATLKGLQDEVSNFVDARAKDFVEMLEDENYEVRILLKKAVRKGILKVKCNRYYRMDDTPVAHQDEDPTLENALNYLKDDQEYKLTLRGQIKNAG